MKLLKKVRQQFIHEIWLSFQRSVPQAQLIVDNLESRGEQIIIDHFAIIDLPSKHSGIHYLTQIFSALGFIPQGHGYLPEKQNEFIWMVEGDAIDQPLDAVLPQVVVADFWMDELPATVQKIVQKYTAHLSQLPLREIQYLSGQTFLGNQLAAEKLLLMLRNHFTQRHWPLPSIQDFQTVREINELLAWVLVFGPIPNHFTLAVHLLNSFDSLKSFVDFVRDDLQLSLNCQGGEIKGHSNSGIEQSSTIGIMTPIELADGGIMLPERFMEFVWRHSDKEKPAVWNDYFTGFIADNANRVIEAVYKIRE